MGKLFWMKLKFLFLYKQTRLILYLTLFVSLFISSVGLYLYSNYRDILDKGLNQPQIELLQINLDVTNRAFRESDEQAVKVSFHPSALGYIQSGLPGKQDAAASLYTYLNTISFYEDVHSFYVVDMINKRLVSNGSQQSYAWADFPDQTWIPWVDAVANKPLLIKRRTLHVTTDKGLELISLYRPILAEGRLIGVVIVNVDYDRFFSKIYSQIQVPQYIFSLDGELIYPKLNMDIPVDEVQKAINTLGVRPFDEVKLDGQAYLANQAFSDTTGWRWVSLIQLEDLLKHVKLVRNTVFLLSLVSIMVGCAAIYYYNYAAFRPLKRIRQLIARNEKLSAKPDLHELEHLVQKLVQEFDVKSSVAESSLPELRSKYIYDVLRLRLGSKELKSKWKTYFEQWTEAPLLAVVLSISRYTEWSADYNGEDQLLLKYALSNIVLELLEPNWRVVSVPLDMENIVLILQSKDNRALDIERAAQHDLQKLTGTVKTYLDMLISIGIGKACDSISVVHLSFEQASIALSYRLYEGYEQTICFSEIEQRGTPAVFSGESWKADMISAAEAGDAQAVMHAVDGWSAYISERQYAPADVYHFVDDMVHHFTAALALHGIPTPAVVDDYTEHRLNMTDLNDIAQMLVHLSGALVTGITRHKGTKEYQLVQRATGFMEQSLHDQIGLQEIAEFVGMSTSSVSSMFKQETGSTVYEYLTKLRIDKACQLLLTTDSKMAEIAAQVGYQNENSFIRSFRKLMAITPGKYRELNKPIQQ